MTVEMDSRYRICQAIEDYLGGLIDNYALDDALMPFGVSTDVACRFVYTEMWYYYDDCSRHDCSGKWALSSEIEAAIRRWLDLLRSGREWTSISPHNDLYSIAIRGWRGVLARLRLYLRGPALKRNRFSPWQDEKAWAQWKRDADGH
jgi:hypothetical protein